MREYLTFNADIKEKNDGIGNRKITVINGLPFYESTGLNSGEKGCWLPMLMIRGRLHSKKLNLDAIPNTFDKVKTSSRIAAADHKATYQLNLVKPSCSESLIQSEGIKPGKSFTKKFAKRIGIKRFLITSSRLNTDYYSDEQLRAAGLSADEMVTARKPIKLIDSGINTSSPEKTNAWLVRQGASYIESILRPNKTFRTEPIHNPNNIFKDVIIFPNYFASISKSSTEKPIVPEESKNSTETISTTPC